MISRGVRISRSGYPRFKLTALKAWIRVRLTIDINPRDRRKGNVESIGTHARSDCREILGLFGQGKHFHQVGGNASEGVTNRCGGSLEFAKREFRNHKGDVAAPERLQEPAGHVPKLVILGSSDY